MRAPVQASDRRCGHYCAVMRSNQVQDLMFLLTDCHKSPVHDAGRMDVGQAASDASSDAGAACVPAVH